MIDQKLLEESVIFSCKKILKEMSEEESVSDLEKERQKDISDQIEKAGSRKPKSVKDSDKANPEVDEEEENLIKGKESEEEDTGDDKFSYDIPKGVPKNVKFDDVIDQLNSVRSGASLKDNEVKRGLLQYYENLKSQEKKDLFAMLSGFATIMNKAGDPEKALNPQSAEKEEKPKKEKLAKISSKKGDSAPIVVGEAAIKSEEYAIVAESNDKKHRCVNGKLVNFGSQRSISDINNRIEDALDSRDGCARGTEKRSHYNGLLKYLRMQLRAAQKLNEKS